MKLTRKSPYLSDANVDASRKRDRAASGDAREALPLAGGKGDELGGSITETRINLLPWRDWERARRAKATVGGMSAAMLVGVVVVAALALSSDTRITAQEHRNRLLQQKLTALDERMGAVRDRFEQAERAAARVEVIRELRHHGLRTVRVLDALAHTLSEGIHYRRVERRGSVLDVVGVAASNAHVAGLMRKLEGSDWFVSASLKRLREEPQEVADGSWGSTFELTILQMSAVQPLGNPKSEASVPETAAEIAPAGNTGTLPELSAASRSEGAS